MRHAVSDKSSIQTFRFRSTTFQRKNKGMRQIKTCRIDVVTGLCQICSFRVKVNKGVNVTV